MAVAEKIKLNAEAKSLGIEGYRTMELEVLKKAIAKAKGGTKAAATEPTTKSKGKTAPAAKSTPTKAKGKTAAKPVSAKGKTTKPKAAPKPAATKPRATKPATAKTTPAKGKSKATAKPTATKAAKGKQATSEVKDDKRKNPKVVHTQQSRPKASKPKRGESSSISRINLTKIKWNKPTSVGQSGKRKEVLDMLREHQDYGIVFKKLRKKATKFWPEKDEHAAERQLVWFIARVAYDYVMNTGQHNPGTRDAYGESKNPINIKRRESRGTATPAPKAGKAKATPTSKPKAASAKAAAKPKATSSKGKKPAAAKKATPVTKAKGKTKVAATTKGKGKR